MLTLAPPTALSAGRGRGSRKSAAIGRQHVRGGRGPQIVGFRHAEVGAILRPFDHADTGMTIRVKQRIALDFRVVAAMVDHQVFGIVLGLGERVVTGAVLAVFGAGLEQRHTVHRFRRRNT